MKRIALPLAAVALSAAGLFSLTGCAHHTTYVAVAPPPPPPGYREQAPPLVQVADRNGFDAGMHAGSHDAMSGRGYQPRHDRAFHDTPGYDPSLGPLPVYRNAFHNAYMRGYDQGFHAPHGMQ
jgi:hypothetical protein